MHCILMLDLGCLLNFDSINCLKMERGKRDYKEENEREGSIKKSVNTNTT